MHAMLEAENGITIMAADTPIGMEYRHSAGVSLSLSGDDDAELSGYFERLADGGTVHEPLEVAPWGDKFGMCTDRFGVDWLVNIAASARSWRRYRRPPGAPVDRPMRGHHGI